ncbi:extracellular calcium-sensing receptor-like [Protopterus annectens]|uniref:extracellular calcium-sensing receptor-like n=1 Tax=Protopterus annectens TaxID=7888 RepID=UPI001CFBAF2E|nr:extracellular calcium-sensing receptor-like [Protopterus annectens]
MNDSVEIMFKKITEYFQSGGFIKVRLDPVPYQEMLTLVYAITKINADHSLLPNITLGFKVLDSCYSEAFAVENSLRLLSEGEIVVPNYSCGRQKKLLIVIAEDFSTLTVPIARLLGIYKFPQISHAAGLPLLSDKIQFPSFLRTAGSLYPQQFGLAEFVKYFGWTWVGILYEDNDFNAPAAEQMKELLAEMNICAAFYEVIPTNIERQNILSLVKVVETSSAAVIIIFSYAPAVALIMEEMYTQNITNKLWIASASWADDSIFSKKELWKILNGTIGFAEPSRNIPGLKDFLYSISPFRYPQDIYMKDFWETVFFCKWVDNETMADARSEEKSDKMEFCTGKENVESLEQSIYPVDYFKYQYNMLNTVFATAHALYDLQSCSLGEGPFSNRTCADKKQFQPWQFFHYVKNVRFINQSGKEVYFDKNGDVPTLYEIVNWQLTSQKSMKSVTVGRFGLLDNPNQGLIINYSAIIWSGGYSQLILRVEVRDFYHRMSVYQQTLTMMVGKQRQSLGDAEIEPDTEFDIKPPPVIPSDTANSAACIKCPIDSWPDERKVVCNLKVMEYLSFEEPLGVALTSLTILLSIIPAFILWAFVKHRDTPIVKANNRSLSYFLLVCLVLCFLCSLMFIGKPQMTTCLLRQSAFGVTFAICVSSILAKTITVVIVFGAKSPGSFQQKCLGSWTPSAIGLLCAVVQIIICIAWLAYASPFPEENTHSFTYKIIIQCNEGSITMFYFMLGYLGFLASICFAVAFLVRKLPDRYNEAKFITFSMLIFVSVWMSFIPAYLSSKGKYLVTVEIFAILSSGFGLLSCIFFPKCYIILLRPNQNIRESVAWKHTK